MKEVAMLIEFRVKNFRSIRNELVLSLVASKDKTLLKTNTQETDISAIPPLLRSAVIYGANASGKSNLIKALQCMCNIIIGSAQLQPGQNFDYSNLKTFSLDADSKNHPSEFEITFILNNVRYRYSFVLTAERIISEYLFVYNTFKPQQLFARAIDPKTNKDFYKFSSGLKGKRNLWKEATRTNSLFLSMASQLNSDQLQQVFNWFASNIIILNRSVALNLDFTLNKLRQTDSKKDICNFLTAADISISDISVDTQKILGQTLHIDHKTNKTELRTSEGERHDIRFHHITETGEATFGLEDESHGTANILFYAPLIFETLKKGGTLVIDELDSTLHPLLLEKLIRMFHCPDDNKNGAQLVFTSHNTSLLDADNLFRRDQIWFVEKNIDQVSNLYALSDFSPRKNEALERGYLIGRYGGLPFLTDFQRKQ